RSAPGRGVLLPLVPQPERIHIFRKLQLQSVGILSVEVLTLLPCPTGRTSLGAWCSPVDHTAERTDQERHRIAQGPRHGGVPDLSCAFLLGDRSTVQKPLKYRKAHLGGVVQVVVRHELGTG